MTADSDSASEGSTPSETYLFEFMELVLAEPPLSLFFLLDKKKSLMHILGFP